MLDHVGGVVVGMPREARPEQLVPILRALAACVVRGAVVRVHDESPLRPPVGTGLFRLVMEVERDEFHGALRSLLDRGAIDSARLFERWRGPGVPEEIRRDGAVEFGQTLILCAEAGYAVEVAFPPPGRPTEIPVEEYVLSFNVEVNAETFYSFRPRQF